MNVRSLFLEKIGDFVGTTVVITATALEYFFRCDETTETCETWVQYVDPTGTLLMATILLIAANSIFKMTVRILMCDAPSKFPMNELKHELESSLLVNVEKNNVWQVDADELIISLVVSVDGSKSGISHSSDVDRLRSEIYKILCKYGGEYETNNFTVQINCAEGHSDGIIVNDDANEQISEKPRQRALSTLRSVGRTSRSPTCTSNVEVKVVSENPAFTK